MRIIVVIGLVMVALIFFKSFFLQLLGLLVLGAVIAIGAYYLFQIAFGFIALGAVFVGIFMVIGLISYGFTI